MKRSYLICSSLIALLQTSTSHASESTSSVSSHPYPWSPKQRLVLDFSTISSSSAASSYRVLSPTVMPGIPESNREEFDASETNSSMIELASSTSPSQKNSERQQFFDRDCHVSFDPFQGSACKLYSKIGQAGQEYLVVAFRPSADNGQRRIGAIIDAERGVIHAWLSGAEVPYQTIPSDVVVSADHRMLVIATGTLLQWFDAQTGTFQGSQRIHKQVTHCISKGSQFFVTRYSDGSACLWPFAFDSTPPYEIRSLRGVIRDVAMSSDGTLSAFVTDEGSCKLFDNQKQICLKEIHFSRQGFTTLALENHLLLIACGKKLFFIDLAKELPNSLRNDDVSAQEFEFSISKILIDPLARYSACALDDHSVQIIENSGQKKRIDVGEKILDLQGDSQELIIGATHQVVRVDANNSFAVTQKTNYAGHPLQFACGKHFAAYVKVPTTVCLLALDLDHAFDPFVKALRNRQRKTGGRGKFDTNLLIPLSTEEQKQFAELSLFSQRSVQERFPLLVPDAAQVALLHNILKVEPSELRVLSEEERMLFQKLRVPVREKVQERFPLLVSDTQQARLVNDVIVKNNGVVAEGPFASLGQSVQDELYRRNRHLIVSDSCIVRGFWRMIDALGLGCFSRNTVRVGTAVLVLAALGIGSWSIWEKYRKSVLPC